MTDRKVIYHPCPECGKTMETVDDPQGDQYISACKHCGWYEAKKYMDIEEPSMEINNKKQSKW